MKLLKEETPSELIRPTTPTRVVTPVTTATLEATPQAAATMSRPSSSNFIGPQYNDPYSNPASFGGTQRYSYDNYSTPAPPIGSRYNDPFIAQQQQIFQVYYYYLIQLLIWALLNPPKLFSMGERKLRGFYARVWELTWDLFPSCLLFPLTLPLSHSGSQALWDWFKVKICVTKICLIEVAKMLIRQ